MNLSAVLLAGGESQRMGRDKARLEISGQPFWRMQLNLLRKLQPLEIFISARADPAWCPADVQLILDAPPSRGALSGLAATLTQMRGSHLLALAIDMPFMSERWLRHLCGLAAKSRGAIPAIGHRLEPLAAIYPAEAVGEFEAALSSNDFSLQTLARHLVGSSKLNLIPVPSFDEGLFRNLNAPDDLPASTTLQA